MRDVWRCSHSFPTVDGSYGQCIVEADRWIAVLPAVRAGTVPVPLTLSKVEPFCDGCFPHRAFQAFVDEGLPVFEFTRDEMLIWEVLES